jgi:hypothetical protein
VSRSEPSARAASPDGEKLGVGRGVRKFARAVARGGEDAAVRRDEDGAHRHLAPVGGGAGLGQRASMWLRNVMTP